MSPADSSFQNPLRGMLIMAGAMVVLPVMDAIAKYMATFEGMSPGQVTFYRFFFQLLCTLPLLLAGGSAFSTRRPWMNLLRGVLHGAASLLFFVAVKYMPLADVFAIYFVEPFILVCLSALFLGDRVGWRRWLAIVVGFGGAMIVIQPSFEIFGLKALLPVACAFLYAIYLFMNRAIGEADSPLAMQTMAGIGGTVFMAGALFVGNAAGAVDFSLSLPGSTLGLLLLLILGSISGYAHILVVRAFRLAPLSLLAPFQYFEIISATVLGYALFGDFPNLSKWIGIAIIVGSGLFIIWRERVNSRLLKTAVFAD
ncbi:MULTISPECIES: DMT family transporter [unclassified Rhizobium]|uniref:DMT family transporter n=1 Tax=unclassified Rhizobium TaxID=2613769 RepID=UPI001ADBD001|nr:MULTISPECIES: DMT family transporter [unclassified Rhizobium]MBO9098494.1 DMT family transporter [Rhizobium sp. L58/93]MBO9132702.1 DMT family transporter [Rhizobium sp. B209b/85]MBO9168760.1 DMT family transporter [Rhizobium sp. L245/93]MBO9184710.1 DMT family transporter [Rhizobium sp. E27B/91]QXZ84889.1 DMT family transporter [Rhizobium sp. K1/93]